MRKALLIGINDYPKEHKLTGCVEDINMVKAAIEKMEMVLQTLM